MADSSRNHSITRSRIWGAAKIILALTLVGIIFSQIHLQDLITLWTRISLPWLAGAVLSFVATLWVVALRYRLLLDRAIPLQGALSLVIIQTITGNLLANSAGVASYITVLLGRYRIPIARSITVYLWSRLGDLVVLFACLLATAIGLWGFISPIRSLIVILLIGVAAILGAVILSVVWQKPFVSFLQHIVEALRLQHVGIVRRIIQHAEVIASQDPRWLQHSIGPMLTLSALGIFSQLIQVYCSLRMFGITIDIGVVIFVITINLLIAIIPLQIFGGLGVVEVTTIYAYGLFGISSVVLAPALLNVRLVFYLLNALLLLYLPFELRVVKGPQEPSAPKSS